MPPPEPGSPKQVEAAGEPPCTSPHSSNMMLPRCGALEETPEERVLVRTILAVEIWEVSNTKLGELDSGWSPDQRPMP